MSVNGKLGGGESKGPEGNPHTRASGRSRVPRRATRKSPVCKYPSDVSVKFKPQNIRWLYISMHPPMFMRCLQCADDFLNHLSGPRRENLRPKVSEVPASEWHDEPSGIWIRVQDRHCVRMAIQRSPDLNLSPHPGDRILVARRSQSLEGNDGV